MMKILHGLFVLVAHIPQPFFSSFLLGPFFFPSFDDFIFVAIELLLMES